MIENPVFSRDETFPATTVTTNNDVFCVFQCDQHYSQEQNQLTPYYNTQVQNTAPLLSQHQCITQQTISNNATQNAFQIKRRRMVYSSSQMVYLESLFTKNKYLDRTERLHVARQLNLSERQIKVWYQNKRMKEKRMQKRADSFFGSRPATVKDPVVALNGPAQSHIPLLSPMSHWDHHHHQQHQQQQQQQEPIQQQQEQPQQPQRQQQQDEEPEQEQSGLAEQRYPNPSVTVHHYPSWSPYAPERLYDPPTTVAVGPQPFRMPSSLHCPPQQPQQQQSQQQQQQQFQHQRQPAPLDATQRAPIQHSPYRRPVLPTYEEAIAALVRSPTQQYRWNLHQEHHQHHHAYCTPSSCPAVPVTPPWGQSQSIVSAAVTANQSPSAFWPQAQSAVSPAAGHSFGLASDPIVDTCIHPVFDQGVLELQVGDETLIF